MSQGPAFSFVILLTPIFNSVTGIPCIPGTSAVEGGRHGRRETHTNAVFAMDNPDCKI